MNIRSFTIACAFSLTAVFGSIPSVMAASCNPQNITELKQLLVQLSPFHGKWQYNATNASGPVGLKFLKRNGRIIMYGNSSDHTGRRSGWYEYAPTFPDRNHVHFRTRSHGWVKLHINSNCSLSGPQQRPYGVVITLR